MKYYGQDGGNQMFSMIINVLSEGVNENNQFKAEVALFSARSLLDGCEDDEGP